MKIAVSPTIHALRPDLIIIPDSGEVYANVSVVLKSDWKRGYGDNHRLLRYIVVETVDDAIRLLSQLEG